MATASRALWPVLACVRYHCGMTPAACRLVDNDQFRFGHALKPEKKTAKEKIKSKLQTFVVTKYYGFDPLTMCAATMKYEGSRTEVAQQKAEVTKIAKKYGGVSGGAEGGRTGYNVTMAIAYIGDFLAGAPKHASGLSSEAP